MFNISLKQLNNICITDLPQEGEIYLRASRISDGFHPLICLEHSKCGKLNKFFNLDSNKIEETNYKAIYRKIKNVKTLFEVENGEYIPTSVYKDESSTDYTVTYEPGHNMSFLKPGDMFFYLGDTCMCIAIEDIKCFCYRFDKKYTIEYRNNDIIPLEKTRIEFIPETNDSNKFNFFKPQPDEDGKFLVRIIKGNNND